MSGPGQGTACLTGGCWAGTLGAVSLCFGQVGPVVSEATTAPAENIFLMFHLLGFIDWFLDY